MSAKKKKPVRILEVEVLDPKPNPMFSEWMTARVRFLRYTEAQPCAECGKKKRLLWTMLVPFRAPLLDAFVVGKSKTVHPPLTAVCGDHPLAPEFPPEQLAEMEAAVTAEDEV